jgi:phage baseplate assembly protein gpV
MLTAGTVNGYTADEDGVYWIFAGDPVTLDHGKVEPGKHFVTWTVSYPSAYNKETGELVVAPKLDGTAVIVTAQIVNNANATVQVNAPMFTVTGLNGYQVGSAIVTPSAGAEIVVTYNPLNIKELGTAIYWVNDNGAIVQTGNTITYRVPAIGGTLTAICAPAAENSTLVVFQNGASTVGTKVISYATYTADDSTIVLPSTPALGTLTVDGWAYNGKKVTDKEIKDLIGTTNVICLVPNVVANIATITVNGTEMTVDVDEYTHLTADASKDGKYFTNWTVSEEGKPDQTFDTEILTYKFKGGEVVTANYKSDDPVARKPVTTVIGNYADNKLVITGLYQTPEGYTMVDAGIIYTTTDMGAADINVEAADVVVKHVTIKDLKSATYTVTLTFKSEVKNVYFRSFVTYRDVDGNEVVIYSDGRTVFNAKTGLVTTEA